MPNPAHPQPPANREPKHPLQAAREARPSPTGVPGLRMSRQELAEAANAYLWQVHRHRENMAEHDIGRYERGEVRWPRHSRRLALRGVLGAGTDIELGFYPHRHTTDQPPPRPAPKPATDTGIATRRGDADLTNPHRRVTARIPDKDGGGLPAGSVTTDAELISTDCAPADPPERVGTLLLARLEDRRRQVLDAVSVGTATRAGIDEWERTVLRHGRATRSRPALRMLVDLEADLADLQRALGGQHRASTLRVLTRITAQMAGLTFLSLIKLNRPVSARAWARIARVAADEAGDPATCCWVWAQEAYVYYYDGHLAEAVEVARHAQELAGRAAAVGVPLAAALEARASAVLGRRRETLSALGKAETALTRLDRDAVTPSAFGYNEAQLRFHEGNALTHLRDTEAAQASQQRALELYLAEDFLDRALVHLDQAQCLIHGGEVNAAAEQSIRAVADLTDQQRAGLVTVRAHELLATLTRQHPAAPGVLQLRDLLAGDTEMERTRP